MYVYIHIFLLLLLLLRPRALMVVYTRDKHQGSEIRAMLTISYGEINQAKICVLANREARERKWRKELREEIFLARRKESRNSVRPLKVKREAEIRESSNQADSQLLMSMIVENQSSSKDEDEDEENKSISRNNCHAVDLGQCGKEWHDWRSVFTAEKTPAIGTFFYCPPQKACPITGHLDFVHWRMTFSVDSRSSIAVTRKYLFNSLCFPAE